jgi:signal transduction histidine kinase
LFGIFTAMKIAPLPEDELSRLQALKDYAVLSSEGQNEFDEIVSLASFICGTPISTITLIDEHRQWFKSKIGLDTSETSRDVAFCAHALLQDDIMIVKDATLDERFHDNPLVLHKPDIRFYAGMPLVTPEGFKLGTICVIDTVPRELTQEQNFALQVLSKQVMKLFELRRKKAELEKIQGMNHQLLSIIGHDLRGPVNSIDGLVLLAEKYDLSLDDYRELIPRMRKMVDTTNSLLLNLLHWAKNQIEGKMSGMQPLDVSQLVGQIIDSHSPLFVAKGNVVVNKVEDNRLILANRNMTEFVLRNLILNANKYTTQGTIKITSRATDTSLEVCITDTGIGMDEETKSSIFLWGRAHSREGTHGEKGSGFGLPMSKEFIEIQNGKIWITSEVNKGTSFYFALPAA